MLPTRELNYNITREKPASFEPTIDYVVVKVPRFAFEKFAQADPTLNKQMKSVGEAMSIGHTFKESLQECLRSLEIGCAQPFPPSAVFPALRLVSQTQSRSMPAECNIGDSPPLCLCVKPTHPASPDRFINWVLKSASWRS